MFDWWHCHYETGTLGDGEGALVTVKKKSVSMYIGVSVAVNVMLRSCDSENTGFR